MKKLFTILALSLILVFCKKEGSNSSTATYCYECDFYGTGYKDAGCMTKERWDTINFTDNLGNDLDKNSKCRKK